MSIQCTAQDRVLTACLSGEVDHHGAKEIMSTLDEELDAVLPAQLIVDLSGVTFMDSSGIAVLLRAYRKMGELGGVLSVVQTPEQAGRVLRAAGLERLFPIDSK